MRSRIVTLYFSSVSPIEIREMNFIRFYNLAEPYVGIVVKLHSNLGQVSIIRSATGSSRYDHLKRKTLMKFSCLAIRAGQTRNY